jgi:asparaginyl-tRNA synthetase
MDATVAGIGKFKDQKVVLKGWVATKRGSGKVQFLELRDGTGTIQCVIGKKDVSEQEFEVADKLTQEAAVEVHGTVKEDARSPIGFELHTNALKLIGASHDYPIQKKEHGDAFLMDHRHLWLRSRRQHAILMIRHTIVKAVRDYFDDNGFVLVDSPILTSNACEGTTTLFETPYFERKAYLSQSGQLYQEAAALAFRKSYCFGPVFRAEKSKTRRHLNEFWMVEPEVAFIELDGVMDLAEDFLCTVVQKVLDKHEKDLKEILERDLTHLKNVKKPFHRISYTDAVARIQELEKTVTDPEVKAHMKITWGEDFGSAHETELTKQFDRPIMVHGYPAQVKAFYMKHDPENPKVARCVDVLAPEGYGEIIGGGQREDNLAVLENAIKEHQLPVSAFQWFLDLRRYGSVPHGGFGLGIERTVAWICGLHHVRETIPFARTLDRLEP